jgi:hypothetical protein
MPCSLSLYFLLHSLSLPLSFAWGLISVNRETRIIEASRLVTTILIHVCHVISNEMPYQQRECDACLGHCAPYIVVIWIEIQAVNHMAKCSKSREARSSPA